MHLFLFKKNTRIQTVTASTYYDSATERGSFFPNDGRRFLSRKSLRFKKRKEEERRGKRRGAERVEARSGPFQRTTLFTCWRYGLPPLHPYFFLVIPPFSPPPSSPSSSSFLSSFFSLLALTFSRKWSRSSSHHGQTENVTKSFFSPLPVSPSPDSIPFHLTSRKLLFDSGLCVDGPRCSLCIWQLVKRHIVRPALQTSYAYFYPSLPAYVPLSCAASR